MARTLYKETVLVIEDNPGFRCLFREALETQGHTVLEAEDGEAGWEMAQTHHPSLILLDLMIPKLDGFKVLQLIKSNPSTKHLLVVILSVLDEPKDIQKCNELGADDYIVKGSYSPERIVQRCCGLLSKAHKA